MIKLNGAELMFKQDTEANVSVISQVQFQSLPPTTLYPAKATLSSQPLQVQGSLTPL